MGGGGVNMPKNPPQNYYPGAYPIAGRMANERERLVGMTDAERAWRAQWLKDQHLSPNEPRVVPELIKEQTNLIRRIYRFPLDSLFKALAPALGTQRANSLRYYTGKFFIVYFSACATHYYFKYNSADWTRKGGIRVSYSRPEVLNGEAREIRTKASEYNNRRFVSSPI